MKPLPQSDKFHQSFGGVRLYRDDLEHILAIMRDAKFDTKITDDRFEYESLDEFQQKRGNSPREIKIEGGTVSLTLSKMNWELASFSVHHLGVIHEIERILRERQTPLANVPLFPLLMLGVILQSVVVSGQIFFDFRSPILSGFISPVSILLAFLAFALFLYSLFRAGVVLNYKHEAGFISRNRDKIIVAVGIALVLVVLQLLIRFLTGKDIQLFGP